MSLRKTLNHLLSNRNIVSIRRQKIVVCDIQHQHKKENIVTVLSFQVCLRIIVILMFLLSIVKEVQMTF